jgi:hypothetical protein
MTKPAHGYWVDTFVPLAEVVAAAQGGITEAELEEQFEVYYDWQLRPCLVSSEAARARLIGLERKRVDGLV